MNEPADIVSLRQALSASPDNVALRLILANSLLAHNLSESAEQEFLECLKHDGTNLQAKLGLCEAYQRQTKFNISQVLIEEFLAQSQPPAKAQLLAAKQYLGQGDVAQALSHYKQAITQDATLQDDALSERLGINADEASDVIDGKIRNASISADGDIDVETELEKPKVKFDDVGGMESVKEEVRLKIIHPLKNKDLFAAYGKQVGGGVLLFGPPGCGKTHLARATAGEIQGNFLSVGLHDVLDMWIGQSEQHLHAIFEQARSNNPTVLFFDEVDALAANRSDLKQSAGRQVINQFLSELDGAENDNEGVLILAATNAPWHMDPAFRRPGRFDRIIFVPPPDAPAREAILGILLAEKPTADIDLAKVAAKTDRYSGADLKNIIDIAIEDKLKDALKTGIPEPLTTKDLLKAIKRHRPSTQEWFASAKNYALYSNQGGIYDDILEYLK